MDVNLWLLNLSEWLGALATVMIAGASPMLKKVRRLEFKYPARDANYALILFVLIYIFAFQYFSNKFFNFFKVASSSFAGGDAAWRMILALVCLLPFIIALIARGQPAKSVGWSRENLRAGLLVGALLAVLTIFLRGKFMTILGGLSQEKLSLLVVVLLYSLAEETIFRGYIQLRLMSRFGQWWGWLITTALYVLWQLPGRVENMKFEALWPILLTALVQGLLLGWIMKKSGHVLAPALYRAISMWMLFF